MCEIRDYRPGDEAGVFRVVRDVLAEYGLATNPDATDADLKDIGEFYLSRGGRSRFWSRGA